MSIWFCHPSLIKMENGFNICTGDPLDYSEDNIDTDMKGIAVEADKIVYIDTNDLQNSLYESFNEMNWKKGEEFNITKKDIFSIKEYESYFEIFVNDKFVATFCKKQDISNFDFEGE